MSIEKQNDITHAKSPYLVFENDLSQRSFNLHWHDEVQIILVIEGCVDFCINYEEHYKLEKDDILVINSMEVHQWDACNYTCKCIMIEIGVLFDFEFIKNCTSKVVSRRVFRRYSEEGEQTYNTFRENINKLYYETTHRNYGYEFAAKACLYRIISDILRYCLKQEDMREHRDLWYKVRDYIESNYTKRIMISDIASEVHLNKHYFQRLFKKMSTKSFLEYLNEYRIRKAQVFLLTTDMKIIEVAENCGFNNLKSFNSCFKNILGCTPREYKKSVRLQ